MNIHILLLLPIALLMAIPESFAQGDDHHRWSPERRQEIKAQQSAYLTRRMNLTPEEAQRFWPIYNRYDEEMEAQRKAHRESMKTLKEQDGPPSESDANTLLDQRLAHREQEQALRRKYDAEFRKSIGALRTWELYQAERDFHREMLRGMRKGDGDRPRPGRQGPER
jgi:Spy/CpxP family protein refolding chaperone